MAQGNTCMLELKVSLGQLKRTHDTRVIHFYYARVALAWVQKKHSLRNGEFQANRASETEEQRKERLRIGREQDRTRRITKIQDEKKSSSETKDHEKQLQAPLTNTSGLPWRRKKSKTGE